MSTRSREALERALHELGLRCTVEEWSALAVACPAPDERGFEDAPIRQRAIEAARRHGFSHLAVEVAADPPHGGSARTSSPGGAGAALPRD